MVTPAQAAPAETTFPFESNFAQSSVDTFPVVIWNFEPFPRFMEGGTRVGVTAALEEPYV